MQQAFVTTTKMNFTLDKQAAKKEIETEQVSKMRHQLRRKKKFPVQPRPQARLHYAGECKWLGTERDMDEPWQARQVTSHPKSARTTGNEAVNRTKDHLI